MRRFLLRFLNVFRRTDAEDDLDREVAAHLALLEDEHRRRGLSGEEAQLAARRALGSVALTKDLHRDARSFAWLDDVRQDVRFAVRPPDTDTGLQPRSPSLTLALGIGATTTLFSLAYGVLMRPLPWSDPDRLVRLQETRGGRVSRVPWTISNGTYLSWREQPSNVEEIGGWVRSRPMTLTSSSEPERFLVGSVTPSLMRVLRADALVGRVFLDSDLGAGTPNVLVLGFGLWQRRFGSRPEVVGELVRLDGQPYTVIGVMPRDFAFPTSDTEAWTRLTVVPVERGKGVISMMLFSAMARLRPGVTPEQAGDEGTARGQAAPDPKQTALALFGNNGAAGVTALTAREVMTAEVRPALLILFAAVALLFLASTASLIVLQLLACREADPRDCDSNGDWRRSGPFDPSVARGEFAAGRCRCRGRPADGDVAAPRVACGTAGGLPSRG